MHAFTRTRMLACKFVCLSVCLSICRERPAEIANAELQMLVKANSKPHDIMMYTDGSVTKGQFGWGITVRQGEGYTRRKWFIQNHDFQSLSIQVRSGHTQYSDTQITHAIILAHSVNLLQKRWSQGRTARTGTHPCRVFGCKGFCGSTALAMY